MTLPHYDVFAALRKIDTGPALARVDVPLGNATATLEKVETIWSSPTRPDYVFRLSIDSKPIYQGIPPLREFFSPGMVGAVVGTRRPDWLPKGVTLRSFAQAIESAIATL